MREEGYEMIGLSYFDRSQLLKFELVSDEPFLGKVRDAFEGKVERFAHGTTADLFRFRKRLESGLWVALRLFQEHGQFGLGSVEFQRLSMEKYCLNAEFLDARGFEVPRFCVGAVYKRRAGILTEDVTADGRYKIDHPPHQADCVVTEDGKKRTVYLDIDGSFRMLSVTRDLRYFSDEAVVDLEKCLR